LIIGGLQQDGQQNLEKNLRQVVAKLLQGNQKCELKQYCEEWRKMGSRENLRIEHTPLGVLWSSYLIF